MQRSLILLLSALGVLVSASVSAQPSDRERTVAGDRKPRRQFVTVTLDGMNTMPLHFKEYPLEQLTGQELSRVFNQESNYRSRDGLTIVDVTRFRRRNRGAGVLVYPFGATNGVSLALRASVEQLPDMRFTISGPGGVEPYQLTDGRAVDAGIGLVLTDRSVGWGLGAHSFVIGGLGKISGERGNGRRIFAEGGGGINVGPFGMQVAVKFAYNRLSDPREHNFFTVPITLRGTISF